MNECSVKQEILFDPDTEFIEVSGEFISFNKMKRNLSICFLVLNWRLFRTLSRIRFGSDSGFLFF